MNKKRWIVSTIALLMVALLGMGCSSSGGDSGDDISMLIGTWKSSSIDDDSGSTTYADTTTLTIDADGSFTILSVEDKYPSDGTGTHSYETDATKGSISIDGNMLSITVTEELEADEKLTEFPTTGFSPISESISFPFLVKDKYFYENCMIRKGSGEGLTGTWTTSTISKEVEEGATLVEENTATAVITASEINVTSVWKEYAEGYESAGDTDSEDKSYTYNVVDSNTITVTKTGGDSVNWDYVIDGSVLAIIEDSDSYMVKQ